MGEIELGSGWGGQEQAIRSCEEGDPGAGRPWGQHGAPVSECSNQVEERYREPRGAWREGCLLQPSGVTGPRER